MTPTNDSKNDTPRLKNSDLPKYHPRQRGPSLHLDSWRDYIKRFYRKEAYFGGTVFFNGTQVRDETESRRLYRWLHEKGDQVSFFPADDLLTRYGLTMDDFFLWCRDEGRPVWYTTDEGKLGAYTLKYGGLELDSN